MLNVPVTRMVDCRCDAMGVVGGKIKGVVLLKVLIGSHAEIETNESQTMAQPRRIKPL